MFSWICARCGRDNRPSATRCIQCGATYEEAEAGATQEFTAPPIAVPQEPEMVESEQTAPAAPRVIAPRPVPSRPTSPYVPPPAKSGLPTWLLTLLCFFAILGIGAAIYFGIQYFRGDRPAKTTGLDPAANVARTKVANPLQKYVEVVGIRLVENRKKSEARFIVVNHSSNQLDDLNATVTLWASTSRSEEDSVGTFLFKIRSLGPFESKEITAPFDTKLKFYELPDWQNATAEVQITQP